MSVIGFRLSRYSTRNMATQPEEELIATQPYEEEEEEQVEEKETKDENKYGVRKNGKPKHKPGRKQKSRYYNYSVIELRTHVGKELGDFKGLSRTPKKLLISLSEWIEDDARRFSRAREKKRLARIEKRRQEEIQGAIEEAVTSGA
jgi:hypothetical protein